MSAIFILIRFLSYFFFFSVKCPGPAGTQNFFKQQTGPEKKKKIEQQRRKLLLARECLNIWTQSLV